MARELYHSIVAKIAIRVPMFAKAIVDKALTRVGANPHTVTPSQMRRAIEEQITPMLGAFLKPSERVKHLGSGLLCVDAAGRLVQASPAAMGMLELRGRAAEEGGVVGRARDWGLLASVEELSGIREELLVREVVTPPGRTLNAAMALVRDRGGAPVGVVSLLQDVTLSVHLETEVDQLFAELERKNASLEASQERLQFYVAELEEATRLKSRLLANVSHELKTPLNAIIGFTGTVLAGVDGPLLDPQRESLELVARSARHLLALIDDLLDMSRVDAGKVSISRERVDVRELVEDACATLGVLAREKGIELGAVVAPDVRAIVTDRTRVRQILVNLLANAIRSTHRGSVRIEVGTGGRDQVQFRVVDTGVGIPAHELENIWKEFHQVRHAADAAAGGTGLGLAISRRYADVLGGALDVESTVGVGSTFTLTLPREGRRSGGFRTS